MSKTWDSSGGPRAVVHKRILDVAGDNPDASLADIAAEISGANADLVDRVLSKYGDPGETDQQDTDTAMAQNGHQNVEHEQTDEQADEGSDDAEDAEPLTDPDDLTEKQLQTVRAVYEAPDAGQAAIADRLGVTRATVSRRLNEIPGFEWSDRAAFTASLFDGTEYDDQLVEDEAETTADKTETATDETAAKTDETAADEPSTAGAVADDADGGDSDGQTAAALDSFEDRLATVEETLEADTDTSERPIRTELAHKVVHAAMESERITEEEELELIAGLLD
jgi:hypothetical protein